MYTLRRNTSIYFFTATNLKWKHLLEEDKHKDIVLGSLSFLHKEERAKIIAFVIMPNHIHVIWQLMDGNKRSDVQRDFLKYIAQQIRFSLIETNSLLLNEIQVNAMDRKTQIWEKNALSFEIDNTQTLLQKLNYIHNNPVQGKWSLADQPGDYYYSSAGFI